MACCAYCAAAGGDADVADNPFDASTAASDATPAAAAAGGMSTPAAAVAGAADGTPSAAATTGVAGGPQRFSDDVTSGPDVHASPATGWMEVYGQEGEDAAAAGASPPGAAAAEEGAAANGAAAEGAGGLVMDDDGNVPFFFMDAYESPDRPGEGSAQLHHDF